MRYLLALSIATLFAFTAHADLPKSSTLKKLGSQINFDISGLENTNSRTNEEHPYLKAHMSLFYTISNTGAVYYRGDIYGSKENPQGTYVSRENFNAKVTRTSSGVKISIISRYPKQYIDLKIDKPYKAITSITYGTATDFANSREKNYAEYWTDYVRADVTDGPLDIKLRSKLLPSDKSLRFSAIKNLSGPMRFSGCDGCEHGDQLFITDTTTGLDVNVISTKLGEFYFSDCPGTLDLLLVHLMDMRLPFRYNGTLSVLTGDLWEGMYKVADQGETYLGSQSKLTLHETLKEFKKFMNGKALDEFIISLSSNRYLRIKPKSGGENLVFDLKTGRIK